ncbi:hypothetical protein D3C79_498390 [compost metagenome]
MLVLKRAHVLAGFLRFGKHKDFIGWRANAQRRLNVLHRDRLMQMHDAASIVFLAFFCLVLPAAGIGAGALVGIAFVDVTGKQAAAGIGHAQCAMHEDLQLHLWHLATDFRHFIQRQLAGKDHPRQAHLLPELHRCPVDRVSLHREVNVHLREGFAHHHDQTGVGHDQRVRAHVDHRFQVTQEGFQFGVVWRDVNHHVESFA